MSTTEEERDHLGAEVPVELKTRVRVEAGKRNLTMSEFIRQTLRDAVE